MGGASDQRFAISPLVKRDCLFDPIRRGKVTLKRSSDDLFAPFDGLDLDEETLSHPTRFPSSWCGVGGQD
jgi:hypothetical protein